MPHPFRIAFSFDFGTFAVIKSLLENQGIYVLDTAMAGHVAIAGADQGYYIEVAPDQKEAARSILREHDMGNYIIEESG